MVGGMTISPAELVASDWTGLVPRLRVEVPIMRLLAVAAREIGGPAMVIGAAPGTRVWEPMAIAAGGEVLAGGGSVGGWLAGAAELAGEGLAGAAGLLGAEDGGGLLTGVGLLPGETVFVSVTKSGNNNTSND